MSIDRELEMILYSTPESDVTVSAIIKDETLWLNQKSLAELFNVDISTINQHLKNIFETQELEQNSTIGKFPIVQTEGKRTVRRTVTFYNLDAIISVGYRVNSKKATAFRKWATSVLNEYIRKGFVMDDDRLKQGTALFGKDYFKELLERVRSIRPANAVSGNRSQISSPSAALITIKILMLLRNSTLPFKINFILPLPEKPQLRSSIPVRIIRKVIWV